MESKNNFPDNVEITAEIHRADSLVEAYRLIHHKDPTGLREWEIARAVVEVIDNQTWVPDNLAKECVYMIVHAVDYPDDETRKDIVSFAEEKARRVFPELADIDEVHMDQIDFVYRKWKSQ